MGALLALIPTKDWLYAGLFVILLAFGAHEYRAIEAKGALQETAAVQVASAKAEATAKAKNDKLTADYSAAVVTVGETYAKAMDANDAANAADLKRLQRSAQTSGSGSHGTVGGAASSAPASDAGTEGAGGVGSVPGQLALDLVFAVRADDSALTQCYADRDSLTGK